MVRKSVDQAWKEMRGCVINLLKNVSLLETTLKENNEQFLSHMKGRKIDGIC